MAVEKAVDLRGEGGTIEEAVEEALDRATQTLEGITSFEVRGVRGAPAADGRPRYLVHVRVWFHVLERMHE